MSKAGRKLNVIIARETAPIFARDPARYKRLCGWVWWAQKHGWQDEVIANALHTATNYLDAAPNWWAYLTKLLPKAKAAVVGEESDRHKNEVGQIASDFVEFMKAKARSR